ncbi:MAG: single-stranded DNA-binding protein [Rectinemataceae bacterium]|jgi:primosomal replication protein N
MKFLNSILLEGDILERPISSKSPDGIPRCTFYLASGDTAPTVPVITYGRLATRCSELLDKGCSIRVVGRISQDLESSEATGSFKLHVVAEHVEIKPAARLQPSKVEAANAF